MSRTIKVNKHSIYEMITLYHKKQQEIEKLRMQLQSVNVKGTAQYGIEATLPKGGGTSDPTQAEALRRIDKQERLKQYSEDNLYIVTRLHRITDETERMVLDCLLDGMTIIATSKHLGVSRDHIHRLRDKIVGKLAD